VSTEKGTVLMDLQILNRTGNDREAREPSGDGWPPPLAGCRDDEEECRDKRELESEHGGNRGC
jgi:hypothetical protein